MSASCLITLGGKWEFYEYLVRYATSYWNCLIILAVLVICEYIYTRTICVYQTCITAWIVCILSDDIRHDEWEFYEYLVRYAISYWNLFNNNSGVKSKSRNPIDVTLLNLDNFTVLKSSFIQRKQDWSLNVSDLLVTVTRAAQREFGYRDIGSWRNNQK